MLKIKKVVFLKSVFIFMLFSFSTINFAEEKKILLKDDITIKQAEKILKDVKIISEQKEIGYYTVEDESLIQIDESKIECIDNSIDNDTNISIDILTKKKEINIDDVEMWGKQWNVKKVTNNGKSYELMPSTSNVCIAIIDSGIDEEHIEFSESIAEGSKNFVPKGGYQGQEIEELGDKSEITDKMGHGTAVASQIISHSKMIGVAPHLKVRSYRVFGQSSAQTDWIISAIIQAADDDNDVINISAGLYLMKTGKYVDGKNDSLEYLAYKRAVKYAYKKGSVIVSAAGNDSLDVNNNKELIDFLNKKNIIKKSGLVVDIPSNFDEVVSVGSFDKNDNRSDFSNYGKKAYQILAPSGSTTNYNSMFADDFFNNNIFETDWILVAYPNNEYQYTFGNSLSAPQVSGAIGLIIEKYGFKDEPQKSVKYLYDHSENINGDLFLNIENLLK